MGRQQDRPHPGPLPEGEGAKGVSPRISNPILAPVFPREEGNSGLETVSQKDDAPHSETGIASMPAGW